MRKTAQIPLVRMPMQMINGMKDKLSNIVSRMTPGKEGRSKKTIKPKSTGKLGAFLGVYTPTVLTIMGVIMYLRFGWVLGEVGLFKTLIIVLLANSITFITALCVSAISTNTKVGVGGAYFIISRSLGLDIGGAIGVPLFLSQALSVTLYSFGLAESLCFLWPGIPVQTAAFVITILVGVLSFKGASFALKTQLPVMVLIAVSLIVMMSGAVLSGDVTPVNSEAAHESANFWIVFAIFFPAVTGIMAGLGLSGDLKEPRSDIPKGTIWATITGLVVYLTIPFFLYMGATREQLLNDPMVWSRIAFLGPILVLPGLWGAIFSSAVGSMLGAPRTLQALSFDRLAPSFLAKTGGKNKEPVIGMVATLVIALGAVFLGELNAVAEVVTMFFLTVYGMINLVAALESLSENPSWRPRIRVPWYVSLAGAFGCLMVMILINLPATLAAIVIELGIYLWFKKQGKKGRWGNLWRDIHEAIIHHSLHALEKHPMSARNWRPHILTFTGSIDERLDLIRFAAWFSKKRGLVTVCELKEGELLDLDFDMDSRRRYLDRALFEAGIDAFGEIDMVHSIESGMIAVSQANGIGNFASNMVMIGWTDSQERLAIFLRVGRALEKIKKSLLIGNIKYLNETKYDKDKEIHLWWGGLQRNGDLILLLAYLLTCNSEWHNARIRIMSIASSALMQKKTEKFLNQLIPEIRIQAEINVMLKQPDTSINEMIRDTSGKADIVLLGLAIPEPGEEEAYARKLTELVSGLDNFFLVRNGSVFIGDLILPEEHVQGEEEKVEES
ncbi:MAG: Na-K-Cl cotransporter [Acidobacteria bacterium]|nr:MAG: Na-K-Cl cotransporter [Acidobacteriota bacterium]